MKYVFIILALLLINNSFSQRLIIDKFSKERIPYVNISVKNTYKGFYSNKRGEFVLKNFIKTGDTLVFSSLGYNSKEIVVGLGNKMDTIFLDTKTETLDEILINNHIKKYEIQELGIRSKGKNRIGGTLGIIKLATFIKNTNSPRKQGIIKELIYRKLKLKFNEHSYDYYYEGVHFKNEKSKVNNDLALKLQLYTMDKTTGFPDLTSPLLEKDVFIKLDKNTRNLKYDISSQKILMPKEGVFLFLEVLGAFNENGEIVEVNGNIFSYGAHKPKENKKLVTYGKYRERPWSKRNNNALFSIKVAYPID